MSKQDRRALFARDTYGRQTLRPLNCLAFILPLLLFFHVGTAFYGSDLLAVHDIAVILRYFGGTIAYLPALLVIVVLLVQHVGHKDRLRVQPKVLAGMLAESIMWVLPLIAMAQITGRQWAHQALSAGLEAAERNSAGPAPLVEQLVSAVGAGIYEEFIFRMVLISFTLLLFVDVFGLRRDAVTVAGVLVGAVLFSLYHFSAEQLTAPAGLPWYDFVFRALAGVYLGAIFVFRGLGIAVGAHAVYNVYVVFHKL